MFCNVRFFGLNSLFMSTTPDDECNFRILLQASLLGEFARKIPNWNNSFFVCVEKYGIFQNGIFRIFQKSARTTKLKMFRRGLSGRFCVAKKHTRMKYPSACTLEFQSVMQILTKVCSGGIQKHNHLEEKEY